LRTSFIWGQRHFMFLPLSHNCSKRIFLQVKNDSSIKTIRLFVIWHFLGFRICQIRQDTIVSDVRQQFRAWVRDLFWQQSDWPIHRILKRVIRGRTEYANVLLVAHWPYWRYWTFYMGKHSKGAQRWDHIHFKAEIKYYKTNCHLFSPQMSPNVFFWHLKLSTNAIFRSLSCVCD